MCWPVNLQLICIKLWMFRICSIQIVNTSATKQKLVYFYVFNEWLQIFTFAFTMHPNNIFMFMFRCLHCIFHYFHWTIFKLYIFHCNVHRLLFIFGVFSAGLNKKNNNKIQPNKFKLFVKTCKIHILQALVSFHCAFQIYCII